MSNQLKLSLKGSASIPHLAERAFLKIASSSSGTNKQMIADNVLVTAHHIQEQLKDIMVKFKKTDVVVQAGEEDQSLPISHWSKTSLTSTSYLQTINNEQKRYYRAKVDFDVRFRDFAALGEFTTRLSSLEHCEVERVDWRLMNATRKSFESRLRTEAAADALKRAQDYCTVFCPGVDVVRIIPVEIKLENENSQNHNYNNSSHMRKTGFAAGVAGSHPGADTGLVFTPQECRMDLNVTVEFLVEYVPSLQGWNTELNTHNYRKTLATA